MSTNRFIACAFLFSIIISCAETRDKNGQLSSNENGNNVFKQQSNSNTNNGLTNDNRLGGRASYTGIEKREGATFAFGLQTKSKEIDTLEYRIEQLIDWKSKPNIKGIAILDSTSIHSDHWKMDVDEASLPAFRFIDDKSDCPIEILISKSNSDKSWAVVSEYCDGKKLKLTSILRKK